MLETSLRAYGREIDELIERERLDEAIAHCRHILQTYPKHLETYRHLGKAYLEAKRYGDAADIFQRVLSAVPDDFVSHVGMAIVREDEGNLDAAIWHMERAFETNPSNPAIQQEMKRLISRRDGLEPHKVRLTRGALARMYAHGELFAQAIAELRSALQEDAERPDLQVLLASMYWQTDQRSDAILISNQILEKLPYCAEANRILAANLQANDRVEEAAVYHRRLANLDPYAAFIESALADANSVEESAVTMEKLDWVAGEPLPSATPGQPGWATTLGMEMQEESGGDIPESAEPAQTGPLPSWLEPGEPPPFEAAAEKELREEMESQAESGTGDLPEGGFLDDLEAETSDQDKSPSAAGSGELSEFLDEMDAGESGEQDFSEPGSEEEESEPRGLGFAAAAAGIVSGVLADDDDEDTKETKVSGTDVASENDAAVAAAAGVTAGDLAGGDKGDSEATADSDAEIASGGEVAAAGMFDRAESAESSKSDSDLGIPEDQLGGSVDDLVGEIDSPRGGGELAADGPKTDGAPEGDIPDWMQEAGWGESKGEFEDAPVSFSDQELKSLDAGEILAEGPGDEEAELAPAELPDWIHDIAPEEAESESDGAGDESLPGRMGAEAPSDDEPVGDAVPPTADTEATSEGMKTEASFPKSESDTGEIPTWITSDPPGATETIVTWLEDRGPDSIDDTAASDDLPDWMRDTGPLDESLDSVQFEELEDVAPTAELPKTESVEEEADAPSAELPIAEPVGDSPEEPGGESPASDSWLSAVAAVAADEEESPSSSQVEADAEPEWLSEAPDTPDESQPGSVSAGVSLAAAAAAGLMASKDEEEPELPPSEGLQGEAPDLEQDLMASSDAEAGASDQDEVASLAAAGEIMTPADGSSFTGETETPEADVVEETGISAQEREEVAEPSDSSSAPDWLEEIGTLPEKPMQTDSADWLEGLEIDGEESTAEAVPDTPDWLKGLAEEGADGDDSGAGPAADWLREIGEPGSVSEEQGPEAADSTSQDKIAEQAEATTRGGAPDWLKGVDSAADEDAQTLADTTPEPEDLEVETPRAPAEEDDEVMDWLQDLAAKQAEADDDEEHEPVVQEAAAAPILEDREIPDAPEEGLEWLEQLADQRGLDVDVSVPGETASPPSGPEPETEAASDTAPGWLGRMATQPIPKVDMAALEAAARGEGVSPDAETIDAQAADIQAQLDEVAREREADIEGSQSSTEVAPDDITIEARAGDLQAEIEQVEEPVESVSSPSEGDAADEIPDWLIAAAEQAEPPSAAPSGLPAEFVEAADKLDVEPKPAASEGQEIPAEAYQPPEPDILEDVVREASVTEEAPEAEGLEGIPAVSSEEVGTADVEDQVQSEPPKAAGAAKLVDATSSEIAEPGDIIAADDVEEPVVLATADIEIAAEAEPVLEDSPAPEAKKTEDLLERSRQALASGDTQSATEMYSDLVKRKKSLDSVIEDLRVAVDRTPDNADLWQVLGDAYMRNDQTDEAIDAYRKGMEAA